ncbi:serine hydrolase [Virgisporangium aurantiacum]|uniref:serine hydrolase n=1 Tax=Virgisporangium aurantiacum TaxID=175570 RepID=UPI00194E421A|nr:serine hydrolase [Virgisporangium aurantiacum]
MLVKQIFDELAITGTACAAPIEGLAIGMCADVAVTPASVSKVQIALAVEDATATGVLDGTQQRKLSPRARTPGPVGISLLRDEVRMSIRDLVTTMLTISDNVATDELIALTGADRINQLTAGLGLTRTRIKAGGLRFMLDALAVEAGFADYAALAGHDPGVRPPSWEQVRWHLHGSAALDPARGWCTTAAETVRLLQAIWTDTAAASAACAAARALIDDLHG